MKKQIRELFTTQTQKKIQSFDNLFISPISYTNKSASYSYKSKNVKKIFSTKGYSFRMLLFLKGVFFLCKSNIHPFGVLIIT